MALPHPRPSTGSALLTSHLHLCTQFMWSALRSRTCTRFTLSALRLRTCMPSASEHEGGMRGAVMYAELIRTSRSSGLKSGPAPDGAPSAQSVRLIVGWPDLDVPSSYCATPSA